MRFIILAVIALSTLAAAAAAPGDVCPTVQCPLASHMMPFCNQATQHLVSAVCTKNQQDVCSWTGPYCADDAPSTSSTPPKKTKKKATKDTTGALDGLCPVAECGRQSMMVIHCPDGQESHSVCKDIGKSCAWQHTPCTPIGQHNDLLKAPSASHPDSVYDDEEVPTHKFKHHRNGGVHVAVDVQL